ncbi:MAG: 30S ribosomal protein S2 [Patescibacteria group bacterium]|nr:30S ribosomal protein S2 [Patescibacteria group bacterium]
MPYKEPAFLKLSAPLFYAAVAFDAGLRNFSANGILSLVPEEIITQDSAKQAQAYPAEASREMIEAGVFYGRKKNKTNPKMRSFVLTNRGGIEVINLQKTGESLDRALGFIKERVRQNGLPLIVGTEPAAENTIKALAEKFKLPYVTLRWIGGTITNFKIISKRVEHMQQLRKDLASGALDKYTKKERLEMEREMNRLIELMGGLENMPKEPDILIMIDPNLHSTAVREARIKKIPIVALANVDADPDLIDYLVPGNDKARKSIEWFLENVERAIKEGISMRAAPVEEKKEA